MSGLRSAHPISTSQARSGFRVLLVDDDPDTLETLRTLLETSARPPRVVTALSAKEALDALEDTPVDLVVADYRMKPMNGLDLLVRARERAPTASRVLITGHPNLQVAIDAINEAGVDYFFPKPIEPQRFVAAVHEARTRRETARRRAERRSHHERRSGPTPAG